MVAEDPKPELFLKEPDLLHVRFGGVLELKGTAGTVVLDDGRWFGPIRWSDANFRTEKGKNRCGMFERFSVSGLITEGIGVDVACCLYQQHPAVSLGMTVTNKGEDDLFLDRLILLSGRPPTGGFSGFPKQSACCFLAQPHHWPVHFQIPDCLKTVPADETGRTHWNTVIGSKEGFSLAIGIGEAARGGAEIDFWEKEGCIGLELNSKLRSNLKNRKLRLPTGKSYSSHQMIFVPGPNALTALNNYTDFVCRYLGLKLYHPPYAGLFAAYGNDPANCDPTVSPLGEKRLSELMQVVDRFLKPYGLNTIKTQFHGYSSSRPGGGPVEKLTEKQARDPKTVAKMIGEIRKKGIAPEHYDSRRDYPHGIEWHVKRLSDKGFRPAFVCRPFYNIKAGTPILDRAASDLFEMTVKDWGYRYLMFDFISDDYDSDNDTITVEQGIYNRFRAVRKRLGPKIFLEACMVWPGPVLGVADGYRPGYDWRGGLEEYLAPIFACRYHFHGRFFQCDNEFFDPALRPFTWNAKPKGLENIMQGEERVRMWVSYNAMLGYSFLAGAALELVDADRWQIFQRAIPPRDDRAKPIDFFANNPPRYWLRQNRTAAGGLYVLGLFNWSKDASDEKPVDPVKWGLSSNGKYLFFDFWKGEVYGPTQTLPNWLAPFSCRILHVQPVTNKKPVLVGSSRHVAGPHGIENWEWLRKEKIIRGLFSGAPNSSERYWIWLPGNEGIAECRGARFEIIRPHLVCLRVNFDGSGRQSWSLKLNRKIPVV